MKFHRGFSRFSTIHGEHFTRLIQHLLAIDYFSEKTRRVMCANDDKIRPPEKYYRTPGNGWNGAFVRANDYSHERSELNFISPFP